MFTSALRLVVLAACSLALLVAPVASAASDFLADRPWLAERSSWSETVPAGRDPVGWWAVGNGRVFGIVGPALGEARIHQITGPHIMLANVMNNGSAFGPARMMLSIDGAPAAFETQRLSRVRGTDIVVMEFAGPDVAMTVLSYAPFDLNAMLRTVIVRNVGTTSLPNVELTAVMDRVRVQADELFDTFQGSTGGGAMGRTRRMFCGFIEPCRVDGPAEAPGRGTLTVPLGNLDPGAEVVRTQYLAFDTAEAPDIDVTRGQVLGSAPQLLEKTRDDWRAWLATTTRLECPNQRLVDLVDDTKILVKIQTAEPQAAAGPMEFFAGVWVRDSNGPFRYALRSGQLDVARRMLEFYYRACAVSHAIPNFMPMDVDVSEAPDADIDWTSAPNDRVEIPSWLILQHRWYHDYTGDLEPVREHWGYLRKCLLGQLTDAEGDPVHTENYGSVEKGANDLYRFPHHGDETWIYPGFEVLNSDLFPEPNDHPHWDSFSADSTWEFVVAAEAMEDFARRLGKSDEAGEFARLAREARAACERDYWQPDRGFYAPALNMRSLDRHQPPFTMVNLNPLWIDYLAPDDPKAVSNLLETTAYTMNPNYLTGATETLRVFVGMQPGMLLYNLAAVGHPYASPALRAMVEIASPSGEYTEKHVTEPDGYATRFLGHRIRPWEAGINLDAAFRYLTGLDPDMGDRRIALAPQLPSGWSEMSVLGRRLAEGELDVRVVDDGRRRRYALLWRGATPIRCDFRAILPDAVVRDVTLHGNPVDTELTSRWGTTTARFEIMLQPAELTVVTAGYERTVLAPPEISRKRYRYSPPPDVQPCDLVLWENEPRKANARDMRTFDYLAGKIDFRLISAFNPADASWLRPFLLRPDGSLNAPVFLMGPNSVASSLKYERWWSAPELAALFREYMERGGVIAALSTGEPSSAYFGDLLGEAEYFSIPADVKTLQAAGPAAAALCETLGLPLGEPSRKIDRLLVYRNMAPLAGPPSEQGVATALAMPYGEGMFLKMVGDLSYEQRATFAERLADPEARREVLDRVRHLKPATAPGAFEEPEPGKRFEDDFSSYPSGGLGLPRWTPIRGTWRMQDGEFHALDMAGYDHCATAQAVVGGDYAVEVAARPVEGIYEAGIVFNLPDRFTFNELQMIRFSGTHEVWCGPLRGGFELRHTIPSGLPVNDPEGHVLRVTVRNSAGVYDIAVDGVAIAEDLPLTVIAAPGEKRYFGLISCRGHIAYTAVDAGPVREDQE